MAFVNQSRQMGTGGVLYYYYNGSNSGFYMGGTAHNDEHCGGCGSGINTWYSDIKKIQFSNDAYSVAGVSMHRTTSGGVGVASLTHGYSCGAMDTNEITRFSFASQSGTMADVGDLSSTSTGTTAGHSSDSNGYVSRAGNILKFAFASSANAPDVGNLTTSVVSRTGSSSSSHGYVCGGGNVNIIERFAYANEAQAADVGDLAYTTTQWAGGTDSNTDRGYTYGGGQTVRFNFANSSSGTDVGNLISSTTERGNGISSTTSCYAAGGGVHETIIERFEFANESSSTNVGNIGGNPTSPISPNWNRYAGETTQF